LERATLLHWAAEQQNLESMKLLLEAGANPDAKNAAEAEGHAEIVELLDKAASGK